jgi:phosphoglycerol transferase MdoB-like AlkP superfamily enzyme
VHRPAPDAAERVPAERVPGQPPGLPERYADRLCLAGILLGMLVVVGFVLRLVLYGFFHDGSFSLWTLAGCLALGLVLDTLVGVVQLAPLLIGLAILRCAWLARPRLRTGLLAAFCALVVFGGLVEYLFFEEFDARFNNIAIDYVRFPKEVAGDIWESYNVLVCVGGALLAGLALALLARRRLAGARFAALAFKARAQAFACVLGAEALALGLLWICPHELSQDRVANEIASNGPEQLVRAIWSADLAYPLYYRTLPAAEARTRAAGVLGFPPPAATADPDADAFTLEKSLRSSSGAKAPSQIVIVLEESLGSDFVTALGGHKGCTPELERHFANGLLLTNLIANGNRTVRGLEGVLASFVPLPGYAILQRGRSENVATIARVLRARGYRTSFFYGGRAIFDHIGSFVEANGWDEMTEESDFPAGDFRTIWGVADEYVFDALLARQEAARAKGEPLFATMLSVSNHKPFEVPTARYPVERDASGRFGRTGAVRYADACIGGYLDALIQRGLAADTLVLLVGDHGARVYGAEEIPIRSYRIPALFVTPDPRWHGQRIERLCSQIDLVPTLLDLAGIECEAPLFGTSVLALPADGGRAFVHHNRDVGILTDDALVVLGLQKTVTFYSRSGRASDEFTRLQESALTPALAALADDASAVFGSAYELYANRRLRLPEDLVAPPASDEVLAASRALGKASLH